MRGGGRMKEEEEQEGEDNRGEMSEKRK